MGAMFDVRLLAVAVLWLGWMEGASAQSPVENFIELEWSTLPDGSLGILPNPAVGDMPGTPPFPLFAPLLGEWNESLWKRLGHVAVRDPYTWVTLLAPGPRDGASTSLADRHLAVRGLETDGDLLALIDGRQPDGKAFQSGPVELDRLLAVRAAATRGLRLAREALEVLAADDSSGSFLARAARESAAELGGLRYSPTPPKLPPWRQRWRELPEDAALVLCVDNTRLPVAASLGTAMRRWTARGIRAEIDTVAGAVPPTVFAGAQMLTEWPGLLGYELARRFGNWRVHRTVAWLGADENEDAAFGVCIDGAFALVALAEGLRAERLDPRLSSGQLDLVGLPDDVRLAATSNWLSLGRGGGATGGDSLADELGAAGAGGDAAIWLHRRDGAAWPAARATAVKQLRWVTRFSTFTLRASFDPEVEVHFTGRPTDAAAMAEVHAWLASARAWAVGAGLGTHFAIERESGHVSVHWRVPDVSPLDALVRAVDAAPNR